MAITRTQIAKQLLAKGGRTGFQGGGADAGTKSFAESQGRSKSEVDQLGRDFGFSGKDVAGDSGRQVSKARADEIKRQKIIDEINKPNTAFQKIKNNPLFKTASFFSNPLGFIGRKIMDERKAKEINELFGVDDDLGYTGADMGFVVSQPTKPEFTPEKDGPQQIVPLTEMIATTPYQKDLVEEELGPIELALRQRDEMGGPRAFAKEGGIMDLEQARQGYKLGKLV